MIYTTGSIAVSGNTLTGTGTNFTAAGSLIRAGCTVLALNSPAQAFQITAINSATSLTVTPAASPAVPAGTKFAILLSDSLSVDGLAQDIAETFTMYQSYMSGFADVMKGVGDVTITINGEPVTVPGQKSLVKKGANSDITSLSGLTTALSIEQGGTGAKDAAGARKALQLGGAATLEVGTAAGTVAAGNDPRLTTLDGKSGGSITGRISMPAGAVGTYLSAAQNAGVRQRVVNDTSATSAVGALTWAYNNGSGYQLDTTWGSVGLGSSAWPYTFMMQTANETDFGARIWTFSMATGDIICSGSGSQAGTFTFTKASNSDREIKHDIVYTDGQESYENVKKYSPTSFVYNDDQQGRKRRGVIAQDVQEIDPEYVRAILNPFTMKTSLSLDTNVMLLDVALALKVAISKIEALEQTIQQLRYGS